MRRREFITLLGGAAAAWPLAARAQLSKMLRVGFVGMLPRESPIYANFLKRMAELGYQEGRNFTFDYIQTPNIEGYEKDYRELAARKVDVFLAVGNEPALRAGFQSRRGLSHDDSAPVTPHMLLSRHTRRRAFIILLGGAAAAWPLAVRAQQPAMKKAGITFAYYDVVSLLCHGVIQLS